MISYIDKADLNLADGTSFRFQSLDIASSQKLNLIAAIMGLNLEVPVPMDTSKIITIAQYDESGISVCWNNPPNFKSKILLMPENTEIVGYYLSTLIGHLMLHSGGILVHGALAEVNGMGVIMAGPSGVGKSTASSRLSAPWRSMSDEATLIVRKTSGEYWAHPMPTWSKVIESGLDNSWKVPEAVPLKNIFILEQGQEDKVIPIGSGQATCTLLECANEYFFGRPSFMSPNEIRTSNLKKWENVSALVRSIPVSILRATLTGQFWKEIERSFAFME